MNISFDPEGLTPYFQANGIERIRFITNDLSSVRIRELVDLCFPKGATIKCKVLMSYKFEKTVKKEKTNIGKHFKINNWHEDSIASSEGFEYTFGNFVDVHVTQLINYCIKTKNNFRSALIFFYTDDVMLYVNNDVLDIVSEDAEFIKRLKDQYLDEYDKYYE